MLESARQQWAEGTRRLESAKGETARYRQLASLVDAVADELRRRVGQTFTLAELAQAYEGAEDWVRDVVLSAAPVPVDDPDGRRAGRERSRVGVRDAALIQDAAFGRYARGASDYRP